MLNLTTTHGFYRIFTQTRSGGNKTIISTYTQVVLTKFNMSTHWLDNTIISLFGSWSISRLNVSWLSWVQQSIITYFSWSIYEILWWYNVCCNALTLSIPQDLESDNLVASFSVQWTPAHGSAGERQCSVNGVQPAYDKSILQQCIPVWIWWGGM